MADVKKLAEEIVGLTLLEAVELKNILKEPMLNNNSIKLVNTATIIEQASENID